MRMHIKRECIQPSRREFFHRITKGETLFCKSVSSGSCVLTDGRDYVLDTIFWDQISTDNL